MSNANIMKNLLSLFKLVFKNNKTYLIISFFFIISSAVLPFINIIYFKYLFDAISFHYSFSYIIKITIYMLIVYLITTNVQIYTKSATTLHSKWLLIPMTSMFCKKSIEMDYQFTEDQSVIQEMDRAKYVLANGDNLEMYLDAVNGLFISIIQFAIIAFLANVVNPFIIVLILAVSIINTVISSKIRKKNYQIHRESLPVDYKWRYIIKLATDIKYAKEVRLFGLKNFISHKGDKNREEYLSLVKIINKNEKKGFLATIGTSIVQEIVVLIILVYMVIFKNLTIGNFNVLMNVTRQFTESFKKFFECFLNLYTINNYLNDFFLFLNRKSQLRETGNLKIELEDKPGKIEFKDVSFHYPNDPRLIIKNINLTIEPGECLVIVGENGAGKTTLIKLLMRLYDVTSGSILYNGKNIKEYDYDSYMKILSTVFQDYIMFSTSIYENITFKEWLENDYDVKFLLEQNQLIEKVESLPYKEQTILTRRFEDDGIELSGGQSQRIAFCRAMYRKSPTLILDEPSASLSPIAENEMYVQFSKIIRNKTSIFISHRLSSSSISDKICVLDDGEIVEYGTHNELMGIDGIYKNMYQLQSQYYKEVVSPA
ncbi:hypothetical protein B4102_3294 [Heyndrickxia sporothermodurans]|uniref:Uncharacterized protein n=1 Tax=Heyndrickxia sporothermodurans TaxID=46224 RepID=A0A150KWL9_9BACI|nr:ABC transporter ATP-binding protein [Heyndrickxia sporothermodurans]KYD04314.1 hypothetical protein B4102_3294 [Heyndrickxia sporothermodurans]